MESSGETKKWPGETDAAYPEVYTTPPTYPGVLKPGQLDEQQFKQFFEEGYVVVDNLFNDNEKQVLEDAKNQLIALVEDLANRLYKAGHIKKLYKEYGLFQRLAKIEEEYPGTNIILHKIGKMPEGFQGLWSHQKLLNISEQLLGTADISGSPVWNIRPKTPRNEPTVVPWHQDNSYFDGDSYKEMIVTAWIPLLNATEYNGCMQVAKKGHRTGKVANHKCCYGTTWYTMLEEEDMQKTLGVDMENDIVTCPVPYGGVLLFSNILPHRSVSNFSNDIRWSLDLRWQKSSSPACFFGSKDAIQMRSTVDPNMKIDWEKFNSVDRHQKAFEEVGVELTEFDKTIQGPWMKRWEIVHINSHTEAFVKSKEDS